MEVDLRSSLVVLSDFQFNGGFPLLFLMCKKRLRARLYEMENVGPCFICSISRRWTSNGLIGYRICFTSNVKPRDVTLGFRHYFNEAGFGELTVYDF
jgi:hypothetical protein